MSGEINVVRVRDELALGRLEGLSHAFWAELPAGTYPPKDAGLAFDWEGLVQYWAALIATEQGALWVLEVDGHAKGFLQAVLYRDKPTGALVAAEEYWYVAEAHRGEGLALWSAWRAWAKETGAAFVTAAYSVPAYRAHLQKFYEATGFTQIAGIFMRKV